MVTNILLLVDVIGILFIGMKLLAILDVLSMIKKDSAKKIKLQQDIESKLEIIMLNQMKEGE